MQTIFDAELTGKARVAQSQEVAPTSSIRVFHSALVAAVALASPTLGPAMFGRAPLGPPAF
jgi:hypothetical protein